MSSPLENFQYLQCALIWQFRRKSRIQTQPFRWEFSFLCSLLDTQYGEVFLLFCMAFSCSKRLKHALKSVFESLTFRFLSSGMFATNSDIGRVASNPSVVDFTEHIRCTPSCKYNLLAILMKVSLAVLSPFDTAVAGRLRKLSACSPCEPTTTLKASFIPLWNFGTNATYCTLSVELAGFMSIAFAFALAKSATVACSKFPFSTS